MEEKKIKLERRRKYAYTVNCPITGKIYRWAGCLPNKTSVVAVSQETYEYLLMSTTTFKNGELVLVEKKDIEDYKTGVSEEDFKELTDNTHTREQVVEILNSNTNSMKALLKPITNKEEVRFVVNTAVELKIDSTAKRNFLNEWSGSEIDFDSEE